MQERGRAVVKIAVEQAGQDKVGFCLRLRTSGILKLIARQEEPTVQSPYSPYSRYSQSSSGTAPNLMLIATMWFLTLGSCFVAYSFDPKLGLAMNVGAVLCAIHLIGSANQRNRINGVMNVVFELAIVGTGIYLYISRVEPLKEWRPERGYLAPIVQVDRRGDIAQRVRT